MPVVCKLIPRLCLLQEAVQCVDELDLGPQLNIFVRVGVESTLERSQITRDHMGQLLFQLVRQGLLPKPQFNKGSVRLPNALGLSLERIVAFLESFYCFLCRDDFVKVGLLFCLFYLSGFTSRTSLAAS